MLHQQVSRSQHCGFVGVYALTYATINGTRTDALRKIIIYKGWHIKTNGDPYDATSVAAVHAAAVEVCNRGGADGWCQTSILDSNTPSLSFYFSKIFTKPAFLSDDTVVQFGNTCYCNAVLQALYHLPAFREACLAHRRAISARKEEAMMEAVRGTCFVNVFIYFSICCF